MSDAVKDPLPVGPVDPEGDRLVTELDELGPYDGWRFSYEYPGYFCYSRPDLPYNVFFTPDWHGVGTMPIEVQDDEGRHCEEHSATLPLPREGRTGRQLLDLVRPTLDKLAKLPLSPEATLDLNVSLTTEEISALPHALDHVRVRMAHDHPWDVRDAAMTAIGKLVTAARKAETTDETTDEAKSRLSRHLAYVEADLESMRRGGSSRTAACLCGWRGHERATLELASDDALMHERSGGRAV